MAAFSMARMVDSHFPSVLPAASSFFSLFSEFLPRVPASTQLAPRGAMAAVSLLPAATVFCSIVSDLLPTVSAPTPVSSSLIRGDFGVSSGSLVLPTPTSPAVDIWTPSSSSAAGSRFLRPEYVFAGASTAAAGLLLFGDKNGVGKVEESGRNPVKREESGLNPGTPPPPTGTGDLEKHLLFVKLVKELHARLKSLLEGKVYDPMQDLDLVSKVKKLDGSIDSFKDINALLEALLTELKDKHDINLVLSLLAKLSDDLAAMEAGTKGKVKARLAKFIGENAADQIMFIYTAGAGLVSFLKQHLMAFVIVAACVKCSVWPPEGIRISVKVLQDTIDDTRAKIVRIQAKLDNVPVEEKASVEDMLKRLQDTMDVQVSQLLELQAKVDRLEAAARGTGKK